MRLKEMRSTSDFHLPRNNTKTLIKSTNHLTAKYFNSKQPLHHNHH